MERKIGEIFEHNGEWYQCLEKAGCSYCDFHELINCFGKFNVRGNCVGNLRSDGKPVIFKKLEKVGEPYKHNGRIFQAYRTCEVPIFTAENYASFRELGNDSKISIEIKQKEDMEEKNLKPFDIEAAKAGKPVCTRDGRKARIICFDKKEGAPIVALVEVEKNERVSEEITLYYINGRAISKDIESKDDLMMIPEKVYGWVNIYEDMVVYESKEEAELNASKVRELIATVKIEWEE